MKRSKVSIKTKSTPASRSFKGQATKHTTVKWSIVENLTGKSYFLVKKGYLNREMTKCSFLVKKNYLHRKMTMQIQCSSFQAVTGKIYHF